MAWLKYYQVERARWPEIQEQRLSVEGVASAVAYLCDLVIPILSVDRNRAPIPPPKIRYHGHGGGGNYRPTRNLITFKPVKKKWVADEPRPRNPEGEKRSHQILPNGLIQTGRYVDVPHTVSWLTVVHEVAHWADWRESRGNVRKRWHGPRHAQLVDYMCTRLDGIQQTVMAEMFAAPVEERRAALQASPVEAWEAKRAHAQAMVEKAETRLKRATTIAKKWRRKLKLYTTKISKTKPDT